MNKIGFDFPKTPRKTTLYELEDWYQNLLAERFNRAYKPINRSNFGEYDMAVHYLTSVLEEAKAINNVAVYNIDHMAQIQFTGKDAEKLLNRVFPADIASMKVGQCKYTLLLTEQGTVKDDMIIMKIKENNFIMVVNAGHDLTDTIEKDGETIELVSDADFIKSYLENGEEVQIEDISDKYVKIDVQGKLSYKLMKNVFDEKILKNRRKPRKNMRFFTFNEFEEKGEKYFISRTGYTNRWGWELYVPVEHAEEKFKKIVTEALELDGLLVGLGGRDENRISAGNVGLPLYGNEYDDKHTPVNAPLFESAVDMNKDHFVGKEALEKEIATGTDKRMVLVITEGIAVGRSVYKDGKRLGTVTSSINSPNVPQEKREFIGSKRKSVNQKDGTAAIGLAWLYNSPYEKDEDGNDVTKKDGKPVWLKVDFYREDKNGKPKGKALKGFIASDGVNKANSFRPLRHIQNL